MYFQGLSPFQSFGILVILLLLGLYIGVTITDIQETRDAETVEAVQISLQTSLSKGIALLELPPDDIQPANIVNAARSSFPKGVSVDPNYHLVIQKSGRQAQFDTTPTGDVILLSLKNFNRFHVENGRIVRSNKWQFTLPDLKINGPVAELAH